MKFEGKAKCRDGTIRDMEVDAKVITYKGGRATLKVARDITDRRHQEEQLRKLSRAVEQSPSTVMITDTKGNIEYVNHNVRPNREHNNQLQLDSFECDVRR